jgi:hypothetical protein
MGEPAPAAHHLILHHRDVSGRSSKGGRAQSEKKCGKMAECQWRRRRTMGRITHVALPSPSYARRRETMGPAR